MATPPRMMVLNYYGYEYFCALPETFDTVAHITAALSVPATHLIRLSLPASDMHRYGLQQYLAGNSVYIELRGRLCVKAETAATPPPSSGTEKIADLSSDNDSFYYAIAGRPFVRFDVHAFERNAGAKSAEAKPGAKEPGKEAPKPGPAAKEKPKPAPKTVEQTLHARTLDNKEVKCTASVTGELAKGPPPGRYLGTFSVDKDHAQAFHGKQLSDVQHAVKSELWIVDGELTTVVEQDQSIVRVLFRPSSDRSRLEMIYGGGEKAVEVSLTLKGWTVSSTYPYTPIRGTEGSDDSLRWFLRVKPNGVIEDVLHSVEMSGIFYELIPKQAPQPKSMKPDSPLVPGML
ncbi:hypothetical protein A1Q1_00894 [Trichosporon asahii var. asahii CBS 2479]|uniref:Uncharacterized protein n=1 Tax=Trichosporon asahii var. asahii (strain ATCC 90039 / CBS 2479 / JCM 2466 / KCTC 7840 / NBRC 103889/ NCYC 2677 / UAMH 7654) TaxID=1186058 RepID=J5T9M9_TRIAS|nr:hypothetical protein A1Q1_00894 [Trichosporon asahii var. asahii CBS 2479]EJT49881.1 hypothetical protein A1Q1_00894 [Trichosporon asahii var. asahii CBS 2479]